MWKYIKILKSLKHQVSYRGYSGVGGGGVGGVFGVCVWEGCFLSQRFYVLVLLQWISSRSPVTDSSAPPLDHTTFTIFICYKCNKCASNFSVYFYYLAEKTPNLTVAASQMPNQRVVSFQSKSAWTKTACFTVLCVSEI